MFLIILFFSIRIYTLHGKSYLLPDFTGLTEAQFKTIIRNNNLRYVIIDSIYSDDFPKGTVVEQVPKGGEYVKKSRKIFFTLNSWTEEQIIVPNLMYYGMRDVRIILDSYGLKIGELFYIPSEDTDAVLGQLYKGKPVDPGAAVPKGSTIDLIIGSKMASIDMPRDSLSQENDEIIEPDTSFENELF